MNSTYDISDSSKKVKYKSEDLVQPLVRYPWELRHRCHPEQEEDAEAHEEVGHHIELGKTFKQGHLWLKN